MIVLCLSLSVGQSPECITQNIQFLLMSTITMIKFEYGLRLGVSSELSGISVDEIDDIRMAVRWFDTVESDYIPTVSCADKIIEMPTIAMNPKSSRRLTLAYFMSFDYSRVKLWIAKRSYKGCSRGICCTQENSKNFSLCFGL